VGIHIDSEVAQILERLCAALGGNGIFPDVPPNSLGHFNFQEMRSMYGWCGREESAFDFDSPWRLNKPLDGC
jgi:hypothetical protein